MLIRYASTVSGTHIARIVLPDISQCIHSPVQNGESECQFRRGFTESLYSSFKKTISSHVTLNPIKSRF